MLDSKLYGGTLNAMQRQSKDVFVFPTAHMQFAAKHIIHDEYSYDATDDGPEVELVRFFRYWPDGRGKGHHIFDRNLSAS